MNDETTNEHTGGEQEHPDSETVIATHADTTPPVTEQAGVTDPIVEPTSSPVETSLAAPALSPEVQVVVTWWQELINHPKMPPPFQQHPFTFLEDHIENAAAELIARLKGLV